jgi:cytochrome c oxidase subunit IV
MNAKETFKNLHNIPIIGDLIIAFAIIVVLTTLSSAGGYFGLKGKEKELLINFYIACGSVYFVFAILKRIYSFFIKK